MQKSISSILLNIKTYTPVISYSIIFHSDITNSSTVECYITDFSGNEIGQSNLDYLYSENPTSDSEIAIAVTNCPRVHTDVSEDLTNRGYGNCLYAASAVLDYRNRHDKVRLPKNSKLNKYESYGISTYFGTSVSHRAIKWWEKATEHKVAFPVQKTVFQYYKRLFDSDVSEYRMNDVMEIYRKKSKDSLSRLEVNATYRKETKYQAYKATLNSFITAGWLPIIIKPDANITNISAIRRKDIEYYAPELFDFVKKNRMSLEELDLFDTLISNLANS